MEYLKAQTTELSLGDTIRAQSSQEDAVSTPEALLHMLYNLDIRMKLKLGKREIKEGLKPLPWVIKMICNHKKQINTYRRYLASNHLSP